MKGLKSIYAIGLAGALGFGLPAQAQIVIDDWTIGQGPLVFVSDNTVDGVGVTAARTATGGTSLTRTSFFANLTAGDGVSTEDCPNCGEGHFVNNANSEGHGFWRWSTGGALDLSQYDSIMLDVAMDVDDVDIVITFSGATSGEVSWSDLAENNLTLQTLMAAVPAGLTSVDTIDLDVLSVGGQYTDPNGLLGTRNYGAAATALDFNVDNFKLTMNVPAPATLLLLAAGLLGMGTRRRQ